jgi:hypothetical protein
MLILTTFGAYDKAYRTTLNWFSKDYDTMSSLLASKRIFLDQTLSILLASFVYNDIFAQPVLVILILIEALMIRRFMIELPYHMLLLNKIWIGQSLLKIWIS